MEEFMIEKYLQRYLTIIELSPFITNTKIDQKIHKVHRIRFEK